MELTPSRRAGTYLSGLFSRRATSPRSDEDQREILDDAITLSSGGIERVLGEYKNANYGTVEFAREGDFVRFFHRGLNYASDVIPVSESRWELLEYTYSYRFEFREDGSVARLWIIHSNGYEVALRKVHTPSDSVAS